VRERGKEGRVLSSGWSLHREARSRVREGRRGERKEEGRFFRVPGNPPPSANRKRGFFSDPRSTAPGTGRRGGKKKEGRKSACLALWLSPKVGGEKGWGRRSFESS